MLRKSISAFLQALDLDLDQILQPSQEILSDLLSANPRHGLTHEAFWTLVARLRLTIDMKRDEAKTSHNQKLHERYPGVLKVNFLMGKDDHLRVDPAALFNLYKGSGAIQHPVVFGEMRREIHQLVRLLGFKPDDLHAGKGEVPLLPDDLLERTKRVRATIEDMLSDSPANRLNDETFQALVERLQGFLNAATHQARKAGRPLTEGFDITSVSIFSDDKFHIDPAKVLRLYKGSFSKTRPPIARGFLSNPSAPAGGSQVSPSQTQSLVGTAQLDAAPKLDLAQNAPMRMFGISIPEANELIVNRLREDDMQRGNVVRPRRDYLRIIHRVIALTLEIGGRPRQAQEGCLDLWVELTEEQMILLNRAIGEHPELKDLEILIHDLGPLAKPGRVQALLNPPIPPNRPAAKINEETKRFISRALKIEVLLRHWTRLRWILSPRVRLSPMAPVIAASGERYYGALSGLTSWRAVVHDWVGTLLLWPLFVVLATPLIVGLLQILIFQTPSAVSLWSHLPLAIACGLLLASFGAQPCSYVLGVVPCGAGTVPVGIAFSLALSVVLAFIHRDSSLLSLEAVNGDPFTAIVGGVVGLSAKGWFSTFRAAGVRFVPGTITCFVLLMWIAIVLSAWLMAQPRRASPIFKNLAVRRAPASNPESSGEWWFGQWFESIENVLVVPRVRDIESGCLRLVWWRCLLAALIGSSGIGVTLGLTNALAAAGWTKGAAFTAAFTIVGGFFTGAVVKRRTGSFKRAGVFFMVHAILTVALCMFTFHLDRFEYRLLALSAACGVFHSTWFTASYVLGEWMGGHEHAETVAVCSAGVESLGFIIFVLIQLLSETWQ